MKTWYLLIVVLSLAATLTADYFHIECSSKFCPPTAVYKQVVNGKEVCCLYLVHSYMVVKFVQEGNKYVEKCNCKSDPMDNIG
ncbi:hypothetical protein RRG08_044572 [Elysia crispata]|uniref:Uncharacterized protein n=1 Tax=Elysia crispata TaxID=231223 RepID=A0AAE0ZTE8_9GAST|nr:hypothetical protein RRG08_044572 [Elysia crispata]